MDPNSNANTPISPSDFDLMVRTVIGEAGNDPSASGVAHVILNRLNNGNFGGNTVPQVVLAKGQFEPWTTRGRELSNIPVNSQPYQEAARVVSGAISGAIPDPTGGATYFYAPETQVALGRKKPAFDDGTGTRIGGQLFFGGTPAQPDFMKDFAVAGSSSAKTAAPPTDFMKDFEVAPPSGAKGAPPAPAANTQAQPDFARDFAVAPSASVASPAPTVLPTYPPNRAPDGQVGPDGLVWNGNNAFDPNTGKLVKSVGAAPGSNPSQALSALGGAIEGVPIVGPALIGVPQRLAAGAQTLTGSGTYGENLAANQARQAASEAEYPTTNLLGRVGGSIAGTAPLMAAAPAMFGLGAGALPLRMGVSALTGGALGGADAAARAYMAGGDFNSVGNEALTGAKYGASGGLAGPLLGQGLESGINALVNTVARITPAARNVANTLLAAGKTPADAASTLVRMGPFGTFADIDPALTLKAGALAESGGAPTSILKSAMQARAQGADDRVENVVATNFGPRPDLTVAEQGIKDARSAAVDPFYRGVHSSPVAVDVTPIMSDIDSQLPTASGSIKSLLKTVKGYLTDDVATATNPLGLTVPKGTSDGILGARQALDDLIYNRDTGEVKLGGNALRVAQDLRGKIDAVAKTDPLLAMGDQIYADHSANLDALKEGQDVFAPSARFQDVQRSAAAKSADPEQFAAMQQGALGALYKALDGVRGDYAAARNMFARGTANRAKLQAIFPNADEVIDNIQHEIAMRATESTVAAGSKTAGITAAREEFSPKKPNALLAAGPAIVGDAFAPGGTGALAAEGANALWGHLRDAVTQNASNRLKEGLARGLAAGAGPAQNDFMGEVERAYGVGPAADALAGGAATTSNLLARSWGEPLREHIWGPPPIRGRVQWAQ